MSLERFDEIAEFFDQVTETRLHWRLRRCAVAPLLPVAGRSILDLGTGPGGLALDLAVEGARVLGLDGSPEMLQRARQRVARAQHEDAVTLVRGDATELPLADDTMDDATGLLVLHLLDDPVDALRECRRVVRAGGRLALVTQCDDFGPHAAGHLDQPIEELEGEFLQGCHDSAASHPRLDRDGWAAAFQAAGLSAPTITHAVPGVAWLLFTCVPGSLDNLVAFPGEDP
jgi:ubiquinone/menaquinone biosynthesis C-methylase UbiE